MQFSWWYLFVSIPVIWSLWIGFRVFKGGEINQVISSARIDSSDYDLASLYILNELAVILYFHLYFDPVCQYQISPLPMTPLLEILYDGTFLKDLLVPKKDIGYIEIMGEKDLTGRMIKVNTKGAPL